MKQFILKQFRKAKIPVEAINFIFCDDEKILEVNREYLKHDYYTDIITFELSLPAEPLLSDIYISIDRVKDNASLLGYSFKEELHRVIFHGILHLMGYKDKSKAEQEQIRKAEDKLVLDYLKLTSS